MKKLIILILLVSSSTVCFCQDSLTKKINKIGIGVNLLFASNTAGLGISPYVSYNTLRHKIGLGPIIGKTPIRYYDPDQGGHYDYGGKSKKTSIVGANIFYQFLPNPPAKIFDLYFENRLSYVLHRIEINTEGKRNLHSIEDIVGFGMKIKFLKRVAFYQGMGVGVVFKTSSNRYYNKIQLYHPFQFSFGLISGLEVNF